MGRLIDCDGDHWVPSDGGWLCEEHPENWFPSRELLDLVWGPLQEED